MRLTKDQSNRKREYLERIEYFTGMIALNKSNPTYCAELSDDLAHYCRLYRELTDLERVIA